MARVCSTLQLRNPPGTGPLPMSLLQLFTATDAAPYAWSLVLAGGSVVASLIPLGAARSAANFQLEDMAAPRAMFERFPDWGKRASWAHQNSFEAFTLHAPAALLGSDRRPPERSSSRYGHRCCLCPPSASGGLHRCLRRQCSAPARTVLGQRTHLQRTSLQRGAESTDQQLISRSRADSPPCPCPRRCDSWRAGFHCRERPDRSADHSG